MKLFKKSKQNKNLNFQWIDMNSITQIEEILVNSENCPQIIFKHSIRCGISSMIISRFEEKFSKQKKNIDFYYLDIINKRDISNEVAQIFKVIHESPQVIIVKNRKFVESASHYAITLLDVDKHCK